MLFEPPPLALYVHLPWCVRKCPYCDFNSHAMPQNMPQREYIEALIEDLDHDLTKVRDRTLISIFFGGGTPSLFSPEEIGRLLETRDAMLHGISEGVVALDRDGAVVLVNDEAQRLLDQCLMTACKRIERPREYGSFHCHSIFKLVKSRNIFRKIKLLPLSWGDNSKKS